MKKYCPVCFRKISVNKNGRMLRHGFKKNRWVWKRQESIKKSEFKKVDSSPCRGSGKIGLTLKQLKKVKKNG